MIFYNKILLYLFSFYNFSLCLEFVCFKKIINFLFGLLKLKFLFINKNIKFELSC